LPAEGHDGNFRATLPGWLLLNQDDTEGNAEKIGDRYINESNVGNDMRVHINVETDGALADFGSLANLAEAINQVVCSSGDPRKFFGDAWESGALTIKLSCETSALVTQTCAPSLDESVAEARDYVPSTSTPGGSRPWI